MNLTPDIDQIPLGYAGQEALDQYDQKQKVDGGGLRFDEGKNLLDLIPPEWTWALGMILTKGAKKYAARNWERGMKWSKVVGPMKRHLTKWEAGEAYDEETGCHHLAMVAWNALALMTYQLRKIGENDLPEYDIKLLDKVVNK